MNILVLAPFLPWPLNQGGKIRLFNIVRHLAKEHAVSLAVLVDDTNGSDAGPLGEFCADLLLVERPARLWPDRIAFFAGRDPYNVVRFRSAGLRCALRELLQRRRFDLVHIEFPMMWQYADLFTGIPTVLGTQNIEHRTIRQIGAVTGNPLMRAIYRLEEKRLKAVEERAWRESALCFAVSDAEREEIAARVGDPAKVVSAPNGVDLERFAFRPKGTTGRTILLLGGMDYTPNLDAARWFLTDIFPRIRRELPEVRLAMVGRELWRIGERGTGLRPQKGFCTQAGNGPSPVERLLHAGGEQGAVEFHEDVPEVLPFFYSADLLVVPLRMGAGTRVKVLEAMAAGLPVVATSKGCEGIGAVNGEHLLVADTPAEFAAAVQRILTSPRLGATLAENARRLVESSYSWQSVVETMMKAYGTQLHG